MGSLLTLLIKALIEERLKAREHKRLIQKIYFEKKLIAAEKAINLWYGLRTSLSTAAHSIKAAQQIKDCSYSGLSTIFETVTNTTKRIEQDLIGGGNSIVLYFDLDKITIWNENNTREFLKEFSEMNELTFEVNIYHSALEKEQDQEMKVKLESTIEAYLPKLMGKINLLAVHFEKMELYYKESIARLRNEILSDQS